MAPDDHDRLRLLRRLEEVLGPEEAAILMTNLPPERWTELATRRDLDAIMARFDNVDRRFDTVDQRFDTIDQRFDAVDQRFDASSRCVDSKPSTPASSAIGHDFQAFDACRLRRPLDARTTSKPSMPASTASATASMGSAAS